MKNISLLSCAVVAILLMTMVEVDATSPRQCGTTCWPCKPVNCACGTYKDECNCCDSCMKCKNEECHMLVGDVCEDGYTCGDPNRDYLEMINNPATCIPEVASDNRQ